MPIIVVLSFLIIFVLSDPVFSKEDLHITECPGRILVCFISRLSVNCFGSVELNEGPLLLF